MWILMSFAANFDELDENNKKICVFFISGVESSDSFGWESLKQRLRVIVIDNRKIFSPLPMYSLFFSFSTLASCSANNVTNRGKCAHKVGENMITLSNTYTILGVLLYAMDIDRTWFSVVRALLLLLIVFVSMCLCVRWLAHNRSTTHSAARI